MRDFSTFLFCMSSWHDALIKHKDNINFFTGYCGIVPGNDAVVVCATPDE
jgi:hypothetical protein